MRTVVIAGARPNFVKVAPLMPALLAAGMDASLIHTGQHYDHAMSDALFGDLGIAPADVNLGAGSGSHAQQTAKVMVAFEEWLLTHGADQVVTVGDVNSAMACALVATKCGVPVAHVEAGLRSFDRGMPEEINRLVVDALATWLFTPSRDGDANLAAEGCHPSRIHFVGNIMVDSLLRNLDKAMARPILSDLGISEPFGLVTLHRPALVDDPGRFRTVLLALRDLSRDIRLVFPVHPRTTANLASFGLEELAAPLTLTRPLGYLDFLSLEAQASVVLTDSGGVQEETTVLGVPCLTLRDNTERPITITDGTNRLVGPSQSEIRAAAIQALTATLPPRRPALWDGHTSERIAQILARGTPAAVWMPTAVGDPVFTGDSPSWVRS